MEKIDYQKQTKDFLQKLNIEFTAKFIKNGKHFDDDKEPRDIYELELKRGSRSVVFIFGQSIKHSGQYTIYKNGNKCFPQNTDKKPLTGRLNQDYHINIDFEVPTEYDLLASLTKYDVGTLENFCSDFDYDPDSKKADKIYETVLEEDQKVCMMFNEEELEQLREIQRKK